MPMCLRHLLTAIALEARYTMRSPLAWDRRSYLLGMTDMLSIASKDWCGKKHIVITDAVD